MDAIEHKDPTKSAPKKMAKHAPKKKKVQEEEEAEESSSKEPKEEEAEKPKPKPKSKNEFLDSVLESTITNKKVSSESTKLNSYEQQQADEADVWSAIAKKGPDEETDDEQPKKKKSKKVKVKKQESNDISDEASAVE